MPKIEFVPPGVDPTRIERPPSPPGCLKYLVFAGIAIGLVVGCALGASLVSHAAPPPRIVTATPTASHTPTGTLSPTATDTATPIVYTTIVSATPGPTTPGPTATATSSVIPPSPTACTITRHVQAGGQLGAIARAFGVPLPTLAALNNIKSPDHIYPGQALIFPCGTTH